jgi:hypothetical protein
MPSTRISSRVPFQLETANAVAVIKKVRVT